MNCRIGVTFTLPEWWVSAQAPEGELRSQAIEYFYDDMGYASYVLLNCSEEKLNEIRVAMIEEGIPCRRHGLCYRAGRNGRQYRWYLRLEKEEGLSARRIEEFFNDRFDVKAEREILGELEAEKNKREKAVRKLQSELEEIEKQKTDEK